jgi:MFS family permease
MTEVSISSGDLAAREADPDPRRWLLLVVIGIAQLMVMLDATIVNIALPSAQKSLGFSSVDRQWVVTAYALAFGSLLLFGGRLGDLIGRKITFLGGLIGFAAASAAGGAATNFTMLVTARACQGAFGAFLAPAALTLLSTTFSDPKERGKAFGVYGAIAGGGGAVGLVVGGVLTEYLSWRWCLYVNVIFAAIAAIGGMALLRRQPRTGPRPKLDMPGVVLVSSSMFCLVYGFHCRLAQLARAVHLRLPGRRRGAADRVRGVARPRVPPAAAATGGAEPQPRRVQPGGADPRRGDVRHLRVPHLLHATDLALLPRGYRPGLPADGRDDRGVRQPV